MNDDADTDEPLAFPPAFERVIRESQGWLAERGETIVGSGCFRSGVLSGSIHSDFGPEDQDKETNQDYVLAWLPHDEEIRRRFRLVLALADGLTASYRSELAAAVVCSVALRALVEGDPNLSPKDRARHAFNEGGRRLGQLADELARAPEASCPPGQFISTWKYILTKGVFFQSTLTLAWLDDSFFRIAMLGDGGAVWRNYRAWNDSPQAGDRVLAQCDLDQHQVCALGPADREVQEFDCWREERLNGPFLCAIHTDGVGRGLEGNSATLLDQLEEFRAAGVENEAQRFIERAVEEWPRKFDDNLTLAVIRCEPSFNPEPAATALGTVARTPAAEAQTPAPSPLAPG
jgi:serine/threonine protein phosphatase PrpC